MKIELVSFKEYTYKLYCLLKPLKAMIRIKILIHIGEQEVSKATDTIRNLELMAQHGIILRKGDVLSFSNVDLENNMGDAFFAKDLRKIDSVVFFSAAKTNYQGYDTVVSYYLVH